MVDKTPYQVKTGQRKRQLRCPGCWRPVSRISTQSHHLFVRRSKNRPELDEDWNIIQVCPDCHMEEGSELQVTAALMKLEQYGPDTIEALVDALPFKARLALPPHYWVAKDMYENGITVDEYFDDWGGHTPDGGEVS
jgi:hypothetical protein